MMLLIATTDQVGRPKEVSDDGRRDRPVTETRQLNVAVRPDLKAWLVQHCRANDIRITDFMNDLLEAAKRSAV